MEAEAWIHGTDDRSQRGARWKGLDRREEISQRTQMYDTHTDNSVMVARGTGSRGLAQVSKEGGGVGGHL